jgi:hypothetical protein
MEEAPYQNACHARLIRPARLSRDILALPQRVALTWVKSPERTFENLPDLTDVRRTIGRVSRTSSNWCRNATTRIKKVAAAPRAALTSSSIAIHGQVLATQQHRVRRELDA